MGIDGIILMDNNGRPIIQSGFRSTSPAYPLVHVDAVNDALSKALRPQDVDPVIHVPSLNIGDAPSACCHLQSSDVRVLCSISGNVDPLFGFAFIQTFLDILQEYFGTVSAATLRENFDTVYQLLEETLDSGGHPLTTSPNALRDIVLPPSLLNKLLSVAGANINTTINSGSGLGGAGGPFSSPIPWRKAGLRYTANEIYFDIVENLVAIINRNSVTLSSNVFGKIEANAKLSGTPDCILSFTNPNVLVDCVFHPCVRLQRWSQHKSLSFIPPDGKFILSEYRYAPNASRASSTVTPASSSREGVTLPFALKPEIDLQDYSASFNIIFTSRLTAKSIENVLIEMNLGEGASGIKCVASRGTASWAFDSQKRVLKWEISNVPPSSSWNLRGSFSTPTIAPRPSRALQVHFDIPTHTFSSLKVDQLKVSGESYKLYKGFRGRSTGNVEWRW
ncbi:Mu homology domain-containing protein [Crepidotus variabilis]|uniref:Mu homology domain-containing protein n=1 Tax=Crepidotus variabilis TaxID=179855 RepID=A0A9P6JV52_9AGAR|nr:Mu homology domain-containing protein [Crepidotus variabilis]